MASICCSPPLRVDPSCRFLAFSTGKWVYILSMFQAFLSDEGFAANKRFSSTLTPGKMCLSAGTYPMPFLTTLWVGNRVVSSPLIRIVPLLGGVRPIMERRVVVFPTPFLPRMETASRLSTSMESP